MKNDSPPLEVIDDPPQPYANAEQQTLGTKLSSLPIDTGSGVAGALGSLTGIFPQRFGGEMMSKILKAFIHENTSTQNDLRERLRATEDELAKLRDKNSNDSKELALLKKDLSTARTDGKIMFIVSTIGLTLISVGFDQLSDDKFGLSITLFSLGTVCHLGSLVIDKFRES